MVAAVVLGLFCSVCKCGTVTTEGSIVMEVTEEILGVNDDDDDDEASNTEYSKVEECDE